VDKKLKKVSQFLCFVLRHEPKSISLDIDSNGWVSVSQLLKNMSTQPKIAISIKELENIVSSDDKNRYSFKGHNQFIRCNQGHSVESVNITFEKYSPKDDMYHGTAYKNLDSILKNGLMPQSRHYVHLSFDVETAKKVGKRHSKSSDPVILVISRDAPLEFFMTENGVINTKKVPAEYITIL
jgi:putative RNA 2'-phosphotransferase